MGEVMKTPMQEIRERAATFHDGVGGFANANKVNAYECDGERSYAPGVPDKAGCGAWIATIDREPGVTPFMVRCGNCGKMAHSKGYKVSSNLTPTFEWYRPDSLADVPEGSLEHVQKGGLLLRPIGSNGWNTPADLEAMQAKAHIESRVKDSQHFQFETKRMAEEVAKSGSRQQRRFAARKGKYIPLTLTMYGRTYRLVEDQ